MAKKRRIKKAAKKTVKPTTRKRRVKRVAHKTTTVGGVFQGALQNLRGALEALLAERARLDGQIAAVEGAMSAIGTPGAAVVHPHRAVAGSKGRRGGHRAGSLKEFLENVLRASGGVMAVKDITEAVIKAGYKSKNKTLAKSVGIALTQMRNVGKVGRGRFRLK
ncbi:MAG: hypothetical protein JXO22_07205 [Phycisphaerae bacterium]|nr:hypothetical protein [Phycisphaerae bacterium]